jgi:hypothetical protein
MESVTKRLVGVLRWSTKLRAKFAGTPAAETLGEIVSGLGVLGDQLVGLPADWKPKRGGSQFAVGDTVHFKQLAAENLMKSGLYVAGDFESDFEVEGVAGRRVRISLGAFPSVLFEAVAP